MSTLTVKMSLLRSLHATWAENYEDKACRFLSSDLSESELQKELWYYGSKAIAGEY